ncbi:MAG: tyrosine phosphatase-like protein [Benniella sp.]|nr:MAG: tyrosine phosphatase-like protein [Benniella sp.]
MAKSTSQTASSKRAPKPIHPVVNAYLIVYNWASFAAWFYVLFQTVNVLLATGNDYTKVYDVVGDHLVWIQTAALLEVLHSLLGFVKSPVGTTAMQVASRLLLVWGICTLIPVPEVRTHWSFTTMTIAWSITECIRYSYYALNLVNLGPSWLVWCRYTFFFILYPVGAGSEALEIYQAIPFAHNVHPAYYYYLWAMIAIYPPGFFVMYTHMIGQRKRYLGPAKSKKAE